MINPVTKNQQILLLTQERDHFVKKYREAEAKFKKLIYSILVVTPAVITLILN